MNSKVVSGEDEESDDDDDKRSPPVLSVTEAPGSVKSRPLAPVAATAVSKLDDSKSKKHSKSTSSGGRKSPATIAAAAAVIAAAKPVAVGKTGVVVAGEEDEDDDEDSPPPVLVSAVHPATKPTAVAVSASSSSSAPASTSSSSPGTGTSIPSSALPTASPGSSSSHRREPSLPDPVPIVITEDNTIVIGAKSASSSSSIREGGIIPEDKQHVAAEQLTATAGHQRKPVVPDTLRRQELRRANHKFQQKLSTTIGGQFVAAETTLNKAIKSFEVGLQIVQDISSNVRIANGDISKLNDAMLTLNQFLARTDLRLPTPSLTTADVNSIRLL